MPDHKQLASEPVVMNAASVAFSLWREICRNCRSAEFDGLVEARGLRK